MPAPTWYSVARVTSPFSISEALAVVPPMSKEIALSMPMRCVRACTPTTPAAGPDSMMCIGVTAAAFAVVSPPFDCMRNSGACAPRRFTSPARRTGSVPPRPQIADFQDVAEPLGGDQPGPRSLVFEDRVRGDCRAVQQLDDAVRLGAGLGKQRGEPVGDRAGIIVDRRGHLLGVALALI